MLLNNGADINAQDKNGMTPLMLAAGMGHSQATQTLLDNKADVHARNNAGMTALVWARRLEDSDIAKRLEQYGAK